MLFLKNLFTKRFVHDLVFIALFVGLIYVLTQNTYLNPKLNPTPGNWSIQLMQHPLLFGLAGHNYLVLRNQDDTITHELHGLATDSITGQWKYIGSNKTDLLKVWEFDGSRGYVAEKRFSGIVLSQGDEDTMKALWNRAEECKETINQKVISYPPYGVTLSGETKNSNSVAYTLSVCMGVDVRHIGVFTPGSRNNLLKQ